MEVQLTPEQKAFLGDAIQSGRLQREEDAIREALSLWEQRERRRAEVISAVEEADASMAFGEPQNITGKSMRELAEDVKRRGRAALGSVPDPNHP